MMSKQVGSRVDYTQGGGGNTSVKYGDGLMAIKASGFRLTDVTEDSGFAVVKVDTLEDVTEAEGFKPLRPSVEANFHALLKKYVIHTHPVYVNLALCSEQGQAAIEQVMSDYKYITVPYINPGQELAEYIKSKLFDGVEAVLLENHGFVVTADTAEQALKLHTEINEKFAKYYGVSESDFGSYYENVVKPLYPDQQVYLTLTDAQTEIFAAVSFIHTTLKINNQTPRSMDSSAQDFIANWESEAYRQSILK